MGTARPARPGAHAQSALVVALLLGCLVASPLSAETPRVLASIEELYRGVHSIGAEINGRGDRVVVLRAADGKKWSRFSRLLFELREVGGAGRVVELFEHLCPRDRYCNPDLVEWASDDLLIAGWLEDYDSRTGMPIFSHSIVEFPNPQDAVEHRHHSAPKHGRIVDVLPNEPDALLFQPARASGSVYRIAPQLLYENVPAWDRIAEAEAHPGVTLEARLDEPVVRWITDRTGAVRAAMTRGTGPPSQKLWVRESVARPWKTARTETREERFDEIIPLAFTVDGERLLVASNLARERYGVYEYDAKTNTLGELVYEHPSGEIQGLDFDSASGELLGARYLEAGEIRQTHFDLVDPEVRRALRAAFKGTTALVLSRSRDGLKATVLSSSQSDPGAYWLLDLTTGGGTELARIRPWLDNNLLAEATVFEVRAEGGPEVEAFLTLPPTGAERPPLIVMPHGGPIGISDSRLFDPDIQYLARMGYAILRVNFRGSGGAGRSFEKAGNRQWGRGIEDDIEAAIDHVVARGWVDGDRICTTGGSYGGYSALMLVVRRPEAYRCASSIMGVTDISLMFNSDDVFMPTGTTEGMTERVGDPDEDYEEQFRFSPVYNASSIRIPVLLAHGTRDHRVDYDHLVRMKLALELEGTPVRTIELRRSGHGFLSTRSRIAYYRALHDFMKEHLSP